MFKLQVQTVQTPVYNNRPMLDLFTRRSKSVRSRQTALRKQREESTHDQMPLHVSSSSIINSSSYKRSKGAIKRRRLPNPDQHRPSIISRRMISYFLVWRNLQYRYIYSYHKRR